MIERIVLASNSPRRAELLTQLGLPFAQRSYDFVEEVPKDLPPIEVAEYIAISKAGQVNDVAPSECLITSDTTVVVGNSVLGKPESYEHAYKMINDLSGSQHAVISGVCIKSEGQIRSFSETTLVWFDELSKEEIDFYIRKYKPYDKAGAYGIQEWIGLIGVTKIEGSFYNVMGLPIQKLYKELQKLGLNKLILE